MTWYSTKFKNKSFTHLWLTLSPSPYIITMPYYGMPPSAGLKCALSIRNGGSEKGQSSMYPFFLSKQYLKSPRISNISFRPQFQGWETSITKTVLGSSCSCRDWVVLSEDHTLHEAAKRKEYPDPFSYGAHCEMPLQHSFVSQRDKYLTKSHTVQMSCILLK